MKISKIENQALSMRIYQACMDAGFADCGIIAPEDMDGYIARVKERIERVPAGQTLYQNAIRDTEQIKAQFPWAKSIVICLSWIGKYQFPRELRGMYAKGFFLSRDSDKEGPEYRQKLKLVQWLDEHHIRWTGGMKDGGASLWGLRHAAMIAGLGVIRRNDFLYNENGSWLELDGFLIDRHCRLYQKKALPPCPPNCRCCQTGCPTGALCAPYTLNPNRCVSFITTFGQGAAPPGIREEQLGDWMVGCDACQDACPFNRKKDWSVGERYPNLDALIGLLQPENIIAASEKELAERVCPLTSDHIPPESAITLKVNAQRALRNRKRSPKAPL